MYEFVIDKMKDAGMNGAIVVTGGVEMMRTPHEASL